MSKLMLFLIYQLNKEDVKKAIKKALSNEPRA